MFITAGKLASITVFAQATGSLWNQSSKGLNHCGGGFIIFIAGYFSYSVFAHMLYKNKNYAAMAYRSSLAG
jgi:hypothetical protein